jgi:hypothetical protein
MSKLEIISELLVNELTDFEKDVTRLEKSIIKAETLQVNFDIKPVEGLIDRLQSYGKQEEQSRNKYLRNLQQNLEQAKIYPNWAVICFIILVVLNCLLCFFAYNVKSEAVKSEKESYNQGVNAYRGYINTFFTEHPKVQKEFVAWEKSKE